MRDAENLPDLAMGAFHGASGMRSFETWASAELTSGGALFFWGCRAHARPMPRYFFTVTNPDQEIDDPDGTILPSDEAAN